MVVMPKKSKYELMVQPRLEEVSDWAKNGVTMKSMGEALGVSANSIAKWAKDHDELAKALQNRFVADRAVENALFKKAIGSLVTLKKPIKVKRIEYSDSGRKIAEYEEVKMVDEEVFYPPETTAIKFWLTNRSPERWKMVIEEQKDNNVEIKLGGLEEFSE